MTSSTAGLEGVNHPCYVADAILEGIGSKVATAASNEALMLEFGDWLGAPSDSVIAFNGVPDCLAPEAEQFIQNQGGCDFVRTGQCPLVRFLVDKVVEEY